jgi:hypothetical protein
MRLLGHADLAHRRFARRHVEHDRNGASHGKRDSDGVVTDDSLGAAGGGHQRSRVAHGDPDTSSFRCGLGIAPRRPEMEGVTSTHQADPKPPGALDGESHGLLAGQLPERMACIEHHSRPAIGYHACRRIGRDRPAANSFEIHVDQHHAMGCGAFEIGLDETVGNARSRIAR